jgi:streptogramin lyase
MVVTCAIATAQSAPQVAYYQLPSGSYPHDVAPAADGGVWFTGQIQGFLGHFDPASQKLDKVSAAAPRRTVSSSRPTAPPGSPRAGRTPSRASIRPPGR